MDLWTRELQCSPWGGYYYLLTCTVCGEVEARSCSNEARRANSPCGHWYLVTEWDGSASLAHITVNGEVAKVIYQDGVCHAVSVEYRNSLFPQKA